MHQPVRSRILGIGWGGGKVRDNPLTEERSSEWRGWDCGFRELGEYVWERGVPMPEINVTGWCHIIVTNWCSVC